MKASEIIIYKNANDVWTMMSYMVYELKIIIDDVSGTGTTSDGI